MKYFYTGDSFCCIIDLGVFKINGIFQISSEDHNQTNFQSGLIMAEAMKYAVEKINNYTEYLLGYKLGIEKIFDHKSDSELRGNVLSTFMKDVPFLIGPYSSESSYIASILTGTFRQVVISYSATYSDFDRSGIKYGYMFRTVPSDKFRLKVLFSLMQRLQWNYISVIGSYGYNGEQDARHFIFELDSLGICSARHFFLPKQQQAIENYIFKSLLELNDDKNLRALVLFTTNEDSAKVLSAIKKLTLVNRFYLICVYGCTNYIEIVQGNEEVANGTISIDLYSPEDIGFKEYFLKKKPHSNDDLHFKKFWENIFNCSLGIATSLIYKRNCTGYETSRKYNQYFQNTPVKNVINAVYAAAFTIRNLVLQLCPTLRKSDYDKNFYHINGSDVFIKSTNQRDMVESDANLSCSFNPSNPKGYSHKLFLMLANISYVDGTLSSVNPWSIMTTNVVQYNIHQLFFLNQKYENKLFGRWKIDRPNFNLYPEEELNLQNPDFWISNETLTKLKNNAVCSYECPINYYRIRDPNGLKAQCCWSCSKCPFNSILLNSTCKPCKETETVNGNRCEELPNRFIKVSGNIFSIILLLITVIGLMCVLGATFIFVRFNNDAVVKSAGRDLCYMILLGISLGFITPIGYLLKPSMFSCVFRKILPGLSLLICYAPLFLKTNRIYRIFKHAKSSILPPSLVSPKSQFLLFLGIIVVQILLGAISFASEMPNQIKIVSENHEYVMLYCKGDTNPLVMFLNFTLSFMFMISCTILAFKTRRFPKNYNEAKYIGITLYITCVVWSVFLPVFFLIPDRGIFIREYLMCIVCIIIGYINLLGLFGRKLGQLLLKKNKNTSSSFSVSNSLKTLKNENITSTTLLDQ